MEGKKKKLRSTNGSSRFFPIDEWFVEISYGWNFGFFLRCFIYFLRCPSCNCGPISIESGTKQCSACRLYTHDFCIKNSKCFACKPKPGTSPKKPSREVTPVSSPKKAQSTTPKKGKGPSKEVRSRQEEPSPATSRNRGPEREGTSPTGTREEPSFSQWLEPSTEHGLNRLSLKTLGGYYSKLPKVPKEMTPKKNCRKSVMVDLILSRQQYWKLVEQKRRQRSESTEVVDAEDSNTILAVGGEEEKEAYGNNFSF